jgi:hypothetical protein
MESNQSNTKHQISHFYTQQTWCKSVQYVKCRQFFVELLYKHNGYSYTECQRQSLYLMKANFCKVHIIIIQICKELDGAFCWLRVVNWSSTMHDMSNTKTHSLS